jgi:methylated-DNA-[protein]-cysteine S-methyltransferase
MMLTCTIDTPLGKMQAATSEGDDAALCGLWFVDKNKMKLADLKNMDTNALCESAERRRPACLLFNNLRFWLDSYFAGKKNLPPLPLAPEGTAFQQKVWKLLLDIPYGQTAAYGEIAKKVAPKTRLNKNDAAGLYARAVGNAVGRNPISIIIPCHRVIGADGSLTGFASGLERKRALLELEGAYTL